jgi:diguanylate cyclase (GGDEF)-like protein
MDGRLSLTTRTASAPKIRLRVAVSVVGVIAFVGGLLTFVVVTLERNAASAARQQAQTQLASAARVASATLAVERADLRARAGEIVASRDLQRAVLAQDTAALRRISSSLGVRIDLGTRAFGRLPAPLGVTSTASLVANGELLARVIVGSTADETLARARTATPLPRHASLMLLRNGRVLAGPFAGTHAVVGSGSIRLGSSRFVAAAAPLLPGMSMRTVAIEPLGELNAQGAAYRRRLLAAAILTMLLVIVLAVRLARPVARRFGELSDQAEHDPLTGLANRRALDARLDEELERARRHHTHVAFVLVDVDDFKHVNDRHGHQCGDDVLRAFARLLAGSVRELDLAGRFGGEEFALVLPGTPVEGACLLAEQIRRSLEGLEIGGPAGERLRIEASFGAAAFPTYATATELVEAADHSLYEAKRLGKNQVVGAGAVPDRRARDRGARRRAASSPD